MNKCEKEGGRARGKMKLTVIRTFSEYDSSESDCWGSMDLVRYSSMWTIVYGTSMSWGFGRWSGCRWGVVVMRESVGDICVDGIEFEVGIGMVGGKGGREGKRRGWKGHVLGVERARVGEVGEGAWVIRTCLFLSWKFYLINGKVILERCVYVTPEAILNWHM